MSRHAGIPAAQVISNIQDVHKGNCQFKDAATVVNISKVYETKTAIWRDYDVVVIYISVDGLFGQEMKFWCHFFLERFTNLSNKFGAILISDRSFKELTNCGHNI